jgi:hypothetical protein
VQLDLRVEKHRSGGGVALDQHADFRAANPQRLGRGEDADGDGRRRTRHAQRAAVGKRGPRQQRHEDE